MLTASAQNVLKVFSVVQCQPPPEEFDALDIREIEGLKG